MNFNGPVGEHIDTVKEMTVNIGSKAPNVKELVWHTFEEKPAKNSVFLVRGEMEGNDHTSEYYVFINEFGERYTSAETGKDVLKLDAFKGYTFTHWAYIPEP